MLATPAPIDGKRAYGYLKKICEIGPRPAGSEANTRQRQMVAEHFTKHGAQGPRAAVPRPDPLTGGRCRHGQPDRLLASRAARSASSSAPTTTPGPSPTRSADPDRRKKPFIGANDGGLGRGAADGDRPPPRKLQTPWGVDLVLFDGEELVYGDNPRRGEYFLGSKEFARAYAEQRRRTRPPDDATSPGSCSTWSAARTCRSSRSRTA